MQGRPARGLGTRSGARQPRPRRGRLPPQRPVRPHAEPGERPESYNRPIAQPWRRLPHHPRNPARPCLSGERFSWRVVRRYRAGRWGVIRVWCQSFGNGAATAYAGHCGRCRLAAARALFGFAEPSPRGRGLGPAGNDPYRFRPPGGETAPSAPVSGPSGG